MGLDTTADAAAIKTAMDSFIAGGNSPGGGMLTTIASILDDGFQKAVPSELNLDITVAAGSLSIPFSGTGSFSKIIGNACAEYWISAVGPGLPTKMAKVSGVVNDASGIASAIEANINALAGGGELTPHYYDFVNAIHKEILTINWKVSESGPGNVTVAVTVT